MNEEEKRKYEAFQYWIQTNTEKGVTTIPDNLCLFVVNLIKSLQKENEKLKFEERKRIIGKYGEVEIHNVINKTLSNEYISVKKIKDKIEYLDKQQKQWLEDRELKASDSEIIFARNFLQELLEESEE